MTDKPRQRPPIPAANIHDDEAREVRPASVWGNFIVPAFRVITREPYGAREIIRSPESTPTAGKGDKSVPRQRPKR